MPRFRLFFGLALGLIGIAIGVRLGMPRLPIWVPLLVLLAGMGLIAAAVLDAERRCATASGPVQRRYTRELLIGMGAYAGLLIVSLLLLRQVEAPTLRAVVALLPILPIALVLRAMVRFIREVDELQQRIELEAVCIAAALVSFGYMTAGFLQAARVIDVPASAAMLWVFPLLCGTYGIAKAVVARRYG
ncbi:hypothetical protein CNR27_02560 [Luteimonas chenhongjianii]|uniref:Uncharacterized protein n=2 Tax=Lysobacteraceae TaxID=32033 RepID=A0A290XBH9_9GAMM|nr:hypothetical protein CNR27_02560 [Luteimonas chenhongjianii]RPD85293.1 hypothetical protein EGK76_10310 [Luteimonas sp. 100069]